MAGIRSTNIAQASAVDEVIANRTQDGVLQSVRISVAALGSQIAAGAGAIVAKQVKATFAQLDAVKATMSEGDIGLVMFDPDEELRGQYALESGVLVRKDDLTETQAAAAAELAKQYRDEALLVAPDFWESILASTVAEREAAALQADRAEDAAEVSEAARDAAMGAVDLYLSTGAGLAATTEGDYFSVPSTDEAEFVVLYRHDAGPVATAIKTYPSANALTAKLGTEFTVQDLSEDSGWIYVIANPDGGLYFGLDGDGLAYFVPGPEVSIPLANMGDDVRAQLLEGSSSEAISDDSGWALAFANSGHELLGGFKSSNGKFWAVFAEDCVFPEAYTSQLAADIEASLLPVPSIAGWGDSMMAGATSSGDRFLDFIADALGRTVYNGGIGGQTSDQVVARQGGLPIEVTVTGDEIPASGSVAVTAKSINILFGSGVFTGTAVGTLAGIAGTMSTDLAGEWTFTRTASGEATPCPPDTVFVLTNPEQYRNWTQLFWVRNDPISTRAQRLAVRDNFLAAVDHMTPRMKHYFIISSCSGATYPDGGAQQLLNLELAATFGDRFIDLQTYMSTLAIYDAIDAGLLDGGTYPTAQDDIDMAAGGIPESLRSDAVHWTEIGQNMGGNFVARCIKARSF